jgi:putative hydrolase of the HAD superfamily
MEKELLTGIRNIIFDLGGVILDIDIPKTKRAFEALGVSNIDEFFGIGKASSIFKEQEIGSINDDDFIAKLGEMGGRELQRDQVIAAWNAMLIRFPHERITLLKQLREKYRLFLFSNTNAIHLVAFQKMFREQFNTALDDLFDKVYYSHIMGLRKPDEKSFRYILEDSQLNAAETLFVDDAKVNIEGAQKVGLRTLFIDNGMDILRALNHIDT